MMIGLLRTLVLPIAMVVTVSCAANSSTSDDNDLVPTIYYKPTIILDKTKCGPNDLKDFISPEGKVLETVCEVDFNRCLMQGSCFIEYPDGKVKSYNVHSKKDNVFRFIEVDTKRCPYGYGVRNSCLDPYFSVAADLNFYQAGDAIFVPRLVGAQMPNGEIHDGYLLVRDKGGGVIGANRFDFFTGFFNHLSGDNVMAKLGFGDPKNRFEFRKATAEEAKKVRAQRSYPGLPKGQK